MVDHCWKLKSNEKQTEWGSVVRGEGRPEGCVCALLLVCCCRNEKNKVISVVMPKVSTKTERNDAKKYNVM